MGYSEWDELVQAVYFIVHPYTDDAKRLEWLDKLLPLIHTLAVSDQKPSKALIKSIENSIEELNPEYYEAVIVPSNVLFKSLGKLEEETDTETDTEEDSDSEYETESEEESEEEDSEEESEIKSKE